MMILLIAAAAIILLVAGRSRPRVTQIDRTVREEKGRRDA
jgi:hypothetical protein